MNDIVYMDKIISYLDKKDFLSVIKEAEQLLQESPESFFGWKMLGYGALQLKRFEQALPALKKAHFLNEKDIDTLEYLALTYRNLGDFDKVLPLYENLAILCPNSFQFKSSHLFLMNYSSDVTLEKIYSHAKDYGRSLTAASTHFYKEWPNAYVKHKPLRIGLVSADLRQHVVAYFLEYVLGALDHEKVEIFVYSNIRFEDVHFKGPLPMTNRLKNLVSKWQNIFRLSDGQAAQLIHNDGIQILCDLSGHSGGHRLGVFAQKPAPIQISWLGYFSSTGVEQMDFILADEYTVPKENQQFFTERVVYLPETRMCYGTDHLNVAPKVSVLPALKNNHITFGSFQNLFKITDQTLASWANILKQLPTSKMRIQSELLGIETAQKMMTQRFEQFGIAADRLVLVGKSTFENYLQAYSEVDVILDTFPFTGGTTTCEALWMGVPTLTLIGQTMISRQGGSMLHAAGLDDWVVDTVQEYERQAINKVKNLETLNELRLGLRDYIQEKALFNAPLFANHLTEVLTQIWEKYNPMDNKMEYEC